MVIRAVGVSALVGGREVLRGVELRVGAGECVALVGANGAGKTTLLRVLATLLPVEGGTLELFGRRVDRGASWARARLGMVGHAPMLYAGLSVRENLELFARLHGVAGARARAEELIGLVGLEGQAGGRAGALSRGQARRASIARALVHDPELLLADEPWDGLDEGAAAVFDGVVRGMVERGRAVVVSAHEGERAAALGGRTVEIREGRLVVGAAGAAG